MKFLGGSRYVQRYVGMTPLWHGTSGIMHDDDATNIVLQDGCPNDLAEHGAVAVDPVTAQHILNALDPAHARPVDCFAADARRT